ncbi:MAG TPA: endoglucanase, partial [Bacteroidales bacterium]|nr:endoglucanase [Bacteroidales bacterium]
IELNQALILNDNPEEESYILSAAGENNDFIIAYTPSGKSIEIDLTKMNSENVKAYWFNPRSGKIKHIGDFETDMPHEFQPWSNGWGSDFLLIIVNKNSSYDFSKFNN